MTFSLESSDARLKRPLPRAAPSPTRSSIVGTKSMGIKINFSGIYQSRILNAKCLGGNCALFQPVENG